MQLRRALILAEPHIQVSVTAFLETYLAHLSISYFIISLEVVLCDIWQKQVCNCFLALPARPDPV